MRPMLSMVLLALAVSQAVAAQPVDFSGKWSFDEKASDSMDAVLTLQQVSWVKRKIAERLDRNFEIEQSDATLACTYDNATGRNVQELFFDGESRATVNPGGFATTLTTKWAADALISVGETDVDGTAATITETLSLSSDRETLTMKIDVQLATGEAASVTRVFNRDPS